MTRVMIKQIIKKKSKEFLDKGEEIIKIVFNNYSRNRFFMFRKLWEKNQL